MTIRILSSRARTTETTRQEGTPVPDPEEEHGDAEDVPTADCEETASRQRR